ncbi:hypothetical protein ABPG72_009495 [Tetrahymena utriculariae]
MGGEKYINLPINIPIKTNIFSLFVQMCSFHQGVKCEFASNYNKENELMRLIKSKKTEEVIELDNQEYQFQLIYILLKERNKQSSKQTKMLKIEIKKKINYKQKLTLIRERQKEPQGSRNKQNLKSSQELKSIDQKNARSLLIQLGKQRRIQIRFINRVECQQKKR